MASSDRMNERILAHLTTLRFTPHGAAPIRDLERALAYELPSDYAAFLVATGGGWFADNVVCRCKLAPPTACDGCTLIDEFLGLSGDDSLQVARRRGANLDMSPSLLAVAGAPGGNFYCLWPGGARSSVVYWDHESGETYVVADSFADLVFRIELDTRGPLDTSGVTVSLDPDLLG